MFVLEELTVRHEVSGISYHKHVADVSVTVNIQKKFINGYRNILISEFFFRIRTCRIFKMRIFFVSDLISLILTSPNKLLNHS